VKDLTMMKINKRVEMNLLFELLTLLPSQHYTMAARQWAEQPGGMTNQEYS
jgi:hypothetical protein